MTNIFSSTNEVLIKVLIGKEKKEFLIKKLFLRQNSDDCHSFKLVIYDNKHKPLDYKKYYKEKLFLEFLHKQKPAVSFVGIIQSMEDRSYNGGNIVIEGKGIIELINKEKKKRSFYNEDTKDIFDGIKQYLEDDVKQYLEDNKSKSVKSEYFVQYDESDYDALRRLAQASGNSLFFTGEKLQYGFDKNNAYSYKLGFNEVYFSSLTIRYKNLDENFGFTNSFTSLYTNEKSVIIDSSEVKIDLESFTGDGSDENKDKEKTDCPVYNLNDRKKLEEITKAEKHKRLSEIIDFLEVRTFSPFFRIGDIISFQEENNVPKGEFIIYDIVHTYYNNTGTLNYENIVKAVPSQAGLIPKISENAKAYYDTAMIIERDSKEKAVRVEFNWPSSAKKESNWIKTDKLGAGYTSSDKKGNSGLHISYQKGDKVSVHYIYNNPLHPRVGLNHYISEKHEACKVEREDHQAISLSTADGAVINLIDKNDKNKAKSTKAVFKVEGAVITIIKGGGVYINTKNDIYLNGENIYLAAKKELTLTAENINIRSENKTEIQGNNKFVLTAKEIIADGSDKAEIFGGDVKMGAKGDATIQGGSVDMKTSAASSNIAIKKTKAPDLPEGVKEEDNQEPAAGA